jgi:predicted Zn-dependent peptidase
LLFGDANRINHRIDQVQAVTVEQVQAAAAQWIRAAGRVQVSYRRTETVTETVAETAGEQE